MISHYMQGHVSRELGIVAVIYWKKMRVVPAQGSQNYSILRSKLVPDDRFRWAQFRSNASGPRDNIIRRQSRVKKFGVDFTLQCYMENEVSPP